MAGFGTLSLAQTVIGTLLDQRAIVLYKQPQSDNSNMTIIPNVRVPNTTTQELVRQLWGNQFKYEELFAGLLSGYSNTDFGMLEKIANITAANPYGISYMDARVNIESEMCDHPIESGALVTDASIIQPVSAEVSVAMPTFFAERIYNQMYDLYREKQSKIILQTKYGIYTDLVLQNISYELVYDKIDRTIFTLTLREIQEAASYGDFSFNYKKVGESNIMTPSDATTVNMGTQIAVGG